MDEAGAYLMLGTKLLQDFCVEASLASRVVACAITMVSQDYVQRRLSSCCTRSAVRVLTSSVLSTAAKIEWRDNKGGGGGSCLAVVLQGIGLAFGHGCATGKPICVRDLDLYFLRMARESFQDCLASGVEDRTEKKFSL
jgi:hypothetical protein